MPLALDLQDSSCFDADASDLHPVSGFFGPIAMRLRVARWALLEVPLVAVNFVAPMDP